MSSIFSLCLIWSMKAGVAVRLHCFTSPPGCCLARVNGGTKASKHIQALLEFAPVGALDPGFSMVLHGFNMERIIKEHEHLHIGAEILKYDLKWAHSIC